MVSSWPTLRSCALEIRRYTSSWSVRIIFSSGDPEISPQLFVSSSM